MEFLAVFNWTPAEHCLHLLLFHLQSFIERIIHCKNCRCAPNPPLAMLTNPRAAVVSPLVGALVTPQRHAS